MKTIRDKAREYYAAYEKRDAEAVPRAVTLLFEYLIEQEAKPQPDNTAVYLGALTGVLDRIAGELARLPGRRDMAAFAALSGVMAANGGGQLLEDGCAMHAIQTADALLAALDSAIAPQPRWPDPREDRELRRKITLITDDAKALGTTRTIAGVIDTFRDWLNKHGEGVR